MALTGRRDEAPLGPPSGLVERVTGLGATLGLDALGLLGERAAIAGLTRDGDVSCGGATRLLPAGDGWFALSLARPDDLGLVPALLERDCREDPWAALRAAAGTRSAGELVERARLLGLPAAVLAAPAGSPGDDLPVTWHALDGPAAPPRRAADVRVVDLSALWAGPLCGSLLARAGTEVVKVESTGRPDGARAGPRPFFDLLNGGKLGVALDLATPAGRAALRDLLLGADVVIEASRPRALQQMGLDPPELLALGGPQVWVSITGHGRHDPNGSWVAFGDDAAVAGGLVAWDGAGPCFCADAVADPLAGLVATVAALDALDRGGRWLIDVALAGVAAWCAGPTLPVPAGTTAAPPRCRAAFRRAPELGEHTAAVLAATAR
jgi:hypothetical protein